MTSERTLKTEECAGGCGMVLTQNVKEGERCCCFDCRDRESRKVEGWTPANSSN